MDIVATDLNRYMNQIRAYEVLSPEDEQRLAVRYYENGDVDAARALVLGNLRFALKIALEYSRLAPVMDLVQEANLGLMEAVRRFNPYRGYRLITYAVWWIRAYIQRFLVESSSVVRRGTTRAQRKALRKLKPARRALEQETGGEVSAAALAEALEIPEEAINAITRANDVSLDLPVGDDEEGAAMRDFLRSEDAGPEDVLIENEHTSQVKQALTDVMADLDEREQSILQLRLLSEDPQTLQELADTYEISRERVRQLESRVKKKLKAAFAETVDVEATPRSLPSGSGD